MYFSHVGKSMYSLQLERWLDLFGRENVKVSETDNSTWITAEISGRRRGSTDHPPPLMMAQKRFCLDVCG